MKPEELFEISTEHYTKNLTEKRKLYTHTIEIESIKSARAGYFSTTIDIPSHNHFVIEQLKEDFETKGFTVDYYQNKYIPDTYLFTVSWASADRRK